MMRHRRKVAIVGSGFIGRSWAILFLNAGYDVNLFDESSDQLKQAITDVLDRIEKLKKNGDLESDLPLKQMTESLKPCESLKSCIRGADYVQECIPEDLELKQSVFGAIEQILLNDIADQTQNSSIILASSTSTLSPTKLSQNLLLKHRFLVGHPVNPPHLLKLVELVPAGWTDKDAIDKAYEIMIELGRIPIKLKKDVPGFVLNRLQYALIDECLRLVAEEVADPEDIDKAMTEGLGPRYAFLGVMEILHLNANGIVDHAKKYDKGYLNVRHLAKPALSLQEPVVLDKLQRYLEKKVPLNHLPQSRQQRDKFLAALARLKNELNK